MLFLIYSAEQCKFWFRNHVIACLRIIICCSIHMSRHPERIFPSRILRTFTRFKHRMILYQNFRHFKSWRQLQVYLSTSLSNPNVALEIYVLEVRGVITRPRESNLAGHQSHYALDLKTTSEIFLTFRFLFYSTSLPLLSQASTLLSPYTLEEMRDPTDFP